MPARHRPMAQAWATHHGVGVWPPLPSLLSCPSPPSASVLLATRLAPPLCCSLSPPLPSPRRVPVEMDSRRHDSEAGLGHVHPHRVRRDLAVGETSVILLHPLFHLGGISIGTKRGCQ